LNTESPDDSNAGEFHTAGIPGLASLRFDPDAILLRDPGLLLDRRFLGALHAELLEETEASEADIALLQMGFLHGLQDAFEAVETTFAEGAGAGPMTSALPSIAPPLAIRMRVEVGGDGSKEQRASIAVAGCWPERHEAAGVLEVVGQPDRAICFLSAGYTSGWLSGTFEVDMLAIESDCSACGADVCSFIAREAAVWRASGDPTARSLLDALPFDALRRFVQCNRDALRDAKRDFGGQQENFSQFRGESGQLESVVHIWGPVMVIPFASGDEALKAVDLLGRDPAARQVSVVVVDLSNAVIDDAFGAVALEQTLDLIEAWGAEAIFAGTTPMSEPAVADLERQPTFILKDLPAAIAVAFQIADAQRRPA